MRYVEYPGPKVNLRAAEGGAPCTPLDPLASLSPKQRFVRCVFHSDEPASVKLMLLAIAQFFDAEGRASSMSLAQIAEACSLSLDTIKRAAKHVRDHWLTIEVQKGYLTRFGRQNLYHGRIPPAVERSLRLEMLKGKEVALASAEGGGPCPSLGGGTMRGVTGITTEDRKYRYPGSKTLVVGGEAGRPVADATRWGASA